MASVEGWNETDFNKIWEDSSKWMDTAIKYLESTNDDKQEERKNPMYLVNPEIITKSKNNSTYEEGCLSVPGQFAEIDRPDKCHLKYLDYYGHTKELVAEGMLATCVQHEMDHLEGILFIDYLSKLKKSMIAKKLVKQKEQIDRIVILTNSR